MIIAAAVVPLLVCLLLSGVRDSIENTNAALLLVLVVVGVAALGSRTAGLVAAVSGAASFDYFLTAPYDQFRIGDRSDIETTVLLLLIGAAVTELALWGRRQQARASVAAWATWTASCDHRRAGRRRSGGDGDHARRGP